MTVRTTLQAQARRWHPGGKLVLLSLLPIFATLGCLGPRSMLQVPSCVERIEVEGEHHRVTDTHLIFSHSLDLPLTRTDVVIDRPDGSREEIAIFNTQPDLLRLFGAGIVGTLSALAIGLYGYQVGTGAEQPLFGPTFLALPIGLGGAGVALAIALTGWHPSGDTIVKAACEDAGR